MTKKTKFVKYEVTGASVSFNAGAVLKLTPQQAAARKHNLAFLKGDKYEVLAQVHFKRGEQIDIPAGIVDKARGQLLTSTEEPVEEGDEVDLKDLSIDEVMKLITQLNRKADVVAFAKHHFDLTVDEALTRNEQEVFIHEHLLGTQVAATL